MPKQETMDVDQFRRAAGIVSPSKPQGNARPKHAPGVMNKTEARMDWELSLLRTAGEIRYYSFESVKLKLAKKTWFTVDFWIVWKDGTIEARDVKGGHVEDDFMVKIKVAAAMFRYVKFTIHAAERGSGWKITEVIP